MIAIISPAKKMNEDTDSLPWRDLPMFLDSTGLILEKLRAMDIDGLKKLWKCNDSIAALNHQRLQYMELGRALTPAILAYEGIQYQYMAPNVFTNEEFEYVQEHLRILSGFYGLLRPFDGIRAYRLEMQAKLSVDQAKDLYSFWGKKLAEALAAETDTVIDLASKEYSSAVVRHLPSSVQLISCVFGEESNGKIIEKGTLCKMARGEMLRFMAENKISSPDGLKSFDRLRYRFSEKHSGRDSFCFILEH